MEPHWLHTHVVMPFCCIQGFFTLHFPRSDEDLQVFWVKGPVKLPACFQGSRPCAWDPSQPGRSGLPPHAAVSRKM